MIDFLFEFVQKEIFTIKLYWFVVIVLFLLSTVTQLFFYLFFYLRIFFHKEKKKNTTEQVPVSVVICAKDEAANLKKFLPSILTQKYENYEVIVINDFSEDNTENVLDELKNKCPKLYVTTIKQKPKFNYGKKLAITLGIKAAKNDWILLTDADCKAVSENWIASMAQAFTPKNEIVLGYGGYLEQKGLLNRLIRFDTAFIALQYMTFAMSGRPYMGVGRNLAYIKTLFFKNKGFAGRLNIESGDDDLFVNKHANKNNTQIILDTDSFTRSEPQKKLRYWLKQKRRHFATARYYKTKHLILLRLEVISRILFYICGIFIASLMPQPYLYYAIGIILFRSILQLFIFNRAFKLLREKKILILGIVFDIFLPIIYFFIGLSRVFKRKKDKWK